jgi:hypothetical protein
MQLVSVLWTAVGWQALTHCTALHGCCSLSQTAAGFISVYRIEQKLYRVLPYCGRTFVTLRYTAVTESN